MAKAWSATCPHPDPEHKTTPDKIGDVVCAEIPDPECEPELHQIVISNMVHGPCGSINPDSPCMEHGRCSKKYPEPFVQETQELTVTPCTEEGILKMADRSVP